MGSFDHQKDHVNENIDQAYNNVNKADYAAGLGLWHELREADQTIKQKNDCAFFHHLKYVYYGRFINCLEVKDVENDKKGDKTLNRQLR